MEYSLDVDVAESLVEVDREEELAFGFLLLGRANDDVLEAFLEIAPTRVVSFALDWSAHDHAVLVEMFEVYLVLVLARIVVVRACIFIVEPEHGNIAILQLLREGVHRILI